MTLIESRHVRVAALLVLLLTLITGCGGGTGQISSDGIAGTQSTRDAVPRGSARPLSARSSGLTLPAAAAGANRNLSGAPDFNGDGKADMLWYNCVAGETSTWLMNGDASTDATVLLTDPQWQVIATPDLNGDGKSDLLWYNAATGQTSAWLMNGSVASSAAVLLGDPNWKVIATPDLDGDGKSDLLWYNAVSGQTSVWLMNGMVASDTAVLLADPNWKVIATPDFDGDGKSDLLWYNAATGQTSIWLMDHTTAVGTALLLTDPDWKVIATPDLNGDGKADLLWYNAATGQTSAWLMNGTAVGATVLLLTDPNWKVTGTPDLNGDGKSDLLWYNASTGQTSAWLMDGSTMIGSAVLLTHPDWKVVATPDFNGDGKSDLLWANAATGQTSTWLMNGLISSDTSVLLSDPNWSVTVTAGAAGTFYGATDAKICPVAGLDFSPYQGNQNPNVNPQVTGAQISARLDLIKKYTKRVRFFSSADGLELGPGIARADGLKVAAGAWISSNLAQNELEIANLIAIGQAGNADLLIVGSEVLLRGDLTEAQLVAYISRVKAAVPSLRVSYADTWSTLLAHPAVIAAVDVVMPNYYPYWEGIAIDDAIVAINDWHARIQAAAGGKPVVPSEAGWPSAGNTVGNAVPSEANATAFFAAFVAWAESNGLKEYYFFEALDEAWKASVEGPQGAHWGLFTADGQLKPGRNATFQGQRVTDTWSNRAIPGGPGQPTLQLTFVPMINTSDNLQGQVLHVAPSAYNVAVYIRVAGGWWTKPYSAAPLTPINFDGSWMTDITTGGFDSSATEIAVYLLPAGVTPPIVLGAAQLPGSLQQQAVAVQDVQR